MRESVCERDKPGVIYPYTGQNSFHNTTLFPSSHDNFVVPPAHARQDEHLSEHQHHQVQYRRQAPPHGGQNGRQAEGEEPGVPRRGNVEHNGQAGLQEG